MLNDVDSRPPAAFHNSFGPEHGVGTELNLDLSLGVGPGGESRTILRSSSAAAVKRSNSAPVKPRKNRVGEMDPNRRPARKIPAWAGADGKPDVRRKVEGLMTNTDVTPLAAPHATGTNAEKTVITEPSMAATIPSDPRNGNRKRARLPTEEKGRIDIMKAMPSVYSKGVEGLLYKYSSKHSISIVCLCHGEFHTPAEFVKHAGGGNVPNPMRCITVSNFDASLL